MDTMSEITIPSRKFLRLFDYLEHLKIDIDAVCSAANLSRERIGALPEGTELSARQYSQLYKQAVVHIQQLKQPIPWGAGVGSEAFELMCHCMIGAKTLGQALDLACRFQSLTYPMLGHNMRLLRETESAVLSYKVNVEESLELVPESWDRSEYRDIVAKASGLMIWHALCGWLIGESIEASAVKISAPYLNDGYAKSLRKVFRNNDVEYDAPENTLRFDIGLLERRIVHTSDSLVEFLDNAVFQLINIEREPASTSAAIRSLIAKDMPPPSFGRVSEYLHMSESSLRRRLLGENTNYQNIKDEVRCQIAIDKLLNEDAKIADLSDYLGFTEPSSFIRSFKSWTGDTPTSYREKLASVSA